MSEKEHSLLQEFANKQITRDQLNAKVLANFDLIPEIIWGISHNKAKVRYGCAKILNDLSAQYPEKAYPYIDEFFALLNSKYRIITWNAIAIIANLASVDTGKKIDAHLEKFYALINDEYMVTVANSVNALGKIAQAKPYLIPKITDELLGVQNLSVGPHLTEECKRAIAEKTIESLSCFFYKVPAEDRSRVIDFVKGHTKSTRKTLVTKAEEFLKQSAYS